MLDLSTRYMGLNLRTPLVVSANPLSQKVDNIAAMEDAGAGAVVLFSLFEEQIRREAAKAEMVLSSTTNAFAEAADFFPGLEDFSVGTGQYLEVIRRAKERVDIPIIASLNGITADGWIEYAREIEQAGADGLEINVYFIPADIRLTATDVELRYLDIVQLVRSTVRIPIAVKMNPYFSSVGHMCQQMAMAGADALVLFNRFYQPDFDIEELKVLSNLELSVPAEIRLPLLWIAVLYGRVPVSLAATTGVHGAKELIKYLLAGADAAMVASALESAARAEELGLSGDHIILSCKVSGVQDLIGIYRELSRQSDYALHLGLTEAGMGSKGIVASTAAMAVLLQEGIGDTIRVSLTPEPGGKRTQEVVVAQEMLQTMGLRAFTPMVTACPGCGRTTSTFFQELAQAVQNHVRDLMPQWRAEYDGVENLTLAVMGCVVNGPGESKHANIGISLPGTGEAPTAPVFEDGVKTVTLRGENIAGEFIAIVDRYVARTYKRKIAPTS